MILLSYSIQTPVVKALLSLKVEFVYKNYVLINVKHLRTQNDVKLCMLLYGDVSKHKIMAKVIPLWVSLQRFAKFFFFT
jgi:hypothetical protein